MFLGLGPLIGVIGKVIWMVGWRLVLQSIECNYANHMHSFLLLFLSICLRVSASALYICVCGWSHSKTFWKCRTQHQRAKPSRPHLLLSFISLSAPSIYRNIQLQSIGFLSLTCCFILRLAAQPCRWLSISKPTRANLNPHQPMFFMSMERTISQFKFGCFNGQFRESEGKKIKQETQ